MLLPCNRFCLSLLQLPNCCVLGQCLKFIFHKSWPMLLAFPFKNQDELVLRYPPFWEAWPQLLSSLLGWLVLVSAEGDWWNYCSRGYPVFCLNEERSLLLVLGLLYHFGNLAEGRTLSVGNRSILIHPSLKYMCLAWAGDVLTSRMCNK